MMGYSPAWEANCNDVPSPKCGTVARAHPSCISHRTAHLDQVAIRRKVEIAWEASDQPVLRDHESRRSLLGAGVATYATLEGLPRLAMCMAPTEDGGPHCTTILATIPSPLQQCSRTPFYHSNPFTSAPLNYKRASQYREHNKDKKDTRQHSQISSNTHTRALQASHCTKRLGTRSLSRPKVVPLLQAPLGIYNTSPN
jgi:hypothetical protein